MDTLRAYEGMWEYMVIPLFIGLHHPKTWLSPKKTWEYDGIYWSRGQPFGFYI